MKSFHRTKKVRRRKRRRQVFVYYCVVLCEKLDHFKQNREKVKFVIKRLEEI